jgi:hypothetical protein
VSPTKNSDQPGQYDSLKAALSAAQAEIPAVKKDKTAHVQPKDGRAYKYSYADLYDMFAVGMPWLAKFGLGFTAKPTINQDGKFVLAYQLFHGATQQEEAGEYALPTSGTPQSVGAAITYAKRQVFSALTGIVADEDNDAHDGAENQTGYQRQGSQQRNGNGEQRPPQQRQQPAPEPAAEQQETVETPNGARQMLRRVCEKNGWDMAGVAGVFEAQYGEPLKTFDHAGKIQEFMRVLIADPDHVLAGTKS